MSLQFALSKQHNVVSSACQSTHATSLHSVICKTHVVHSHRFSPGFAVWAQADGSLSRDDTLQYGNVSERSSASHRSDPDRTHTRSFSSLLPLSATPPSLLQLLALHMCSSFLHWPINHVRSHTQSCTLCPRESSYWQANRQTHTHTHTHTHTEPNPSLFSAPTCHTHKHFLLPVSLSLTCPVSLHLAAKHLAWNSLCNIIPWYLKNPERSITDSTKILSSTIVFNTDNKQKCFLSS